MSSFASFLRSKFILSVVGLLKTLANIISRSPLLQSLSCDADLSQVSITIMKQEVGTSPLKGQYYRNDLV